MCSTIESLRQTITRSKITNLKYIFINVGVNDTDENTAERVAQDIEDVIHVIRGKYVGIKIILSLLTPRNDDKDSVVID